MIKPPMLKPGDTLGIVAPASPAADERREKAKQAVEELGFQVKLGRSCFFKWGYLAGPDEVRAADINSMFLDPQIKGLICLRGGYGGLRLLKLLDYGRIRANPKVFVGYSDITALHIAINQKSGMITFHGPMAASDMAEGFDPFSRASLLQAIMTAEAPGEIRNPGNEPFGCLVPGICSGRIIGGNLSVLVSTLGTPYEIDTKDKILLLEDIDEKPYRIDRMMAQLALAGKLRDAGGLVLGSWRNCQADPNESQTLAEVFADILVAANRPTIYNAAIGHSSPMITIPLGSKCCLNAGEGKLTVIESGVAAR